MEIKIAQNDTFHDTLVKCVKHYLRTDTNPADLGYMLALEAINVLIAYAPSTPAAYAILFSALESFNCEQAKEIDGEQMEDQQNAPSTRTTQ
jgi:hypothetical protein